MGNQTEHFLLSFVPLTGPGPQFTTAGETSAKSLLLPTTLLICNCFLPCLPDGEVLEDPRMGFPGAPLSLVLQAGILCFS